MILILISVSVMLGMGTSLIEEPRPKNLPDTMCKIRLGRLRSVEIAFILTICISVVEKC